MPQPIYAIGDIHGQRTMLEDALARIESDGGANARVVFLGDYTDRGPDSRGVLDLLIEGQRAGRDWIMLRGNHDRMFLDYLETGNPQNPLIRAAKVRASGQGWLHEMLGGLTTLAAYGVDIALTGQDLWHASRAAVPQFHVDFLRACPPYHIENGLLFVHAGIDPRLPLEWKTEEQLLWIRDPFLDHSEPFNWLVVHGHSSIELPRHYGNRVNLDSGAGFGRPLTAAVLDKGRVWVLSGHGRIPLDP